MKKKILCLIFTFLFLFSCFPLLVFAEEKSVASSASAELTATDLSKTTIEYDFKYIYAGRLKLENYLENPLDKELHLISAMESKDASGNYELYIYIYNPSRQAIVKTSSHNTVNIAQGDTSNFSKKSIELITMTENKNVEASFTDALILKYRVNIDKSESRIYKIADIEILKQGEALPKYFIGGMEYEFFESSGGYTSCTSRDLSVVETETFHTYYRFDADGINEYNDLRAVYFPVPNAYLDMYGGHMAYIQASWELYDSNYIFITDDLELQKEFKSVVGLGNYSSSFKYSLLYNQAHMTSLYEFFHDFYLHAYQVENLKEYLSVEYDENYLSYYSLPGKFEYIGAPLKTNTEIPISHSIYVNDTLTVGKLAAYKELEGYFKDKCSPSSDYVSYKGSFDKTFYFETTSDSVPEYARCSWWQAVLNDFQYYNKMSEEEKNAFYNFVKIDKSDILSLTDEELSKKYYVSMTDIAEFKQNISNSEYSNYTWFLLRYDTTDYKTENAIAVNSSNGEVVGNSYLARYDIVYDFDFITIAFGEADKPETHHVYPVGNSPTSAVVAIFNPEKPSIGFDDLLPDDPYAKFFEFLEKLLAVTLVLVGMVIVLKIVGIFKQKKVINNYYGKESKK